MVNVGPPEIVGRTKKFGITIIKLVNSFPKTPAGFACAHQLVRSGTSIGANVSEAQEAVSKQDFIYKISLAVKESLETQYWLDIIEKSDLLVNLDKIKPLKNECDEITKILRTILKKSRQSINH